MEFRRIIFQMARWGEVFGTGVDSSEDAYRICSLQPYEIIMKISNVSWKCFKKKDRVS